ncbi:hypothetical protein GCM10023082_16850 [Streptomyces tremellae]|uniref:Uncharacterized protein n=1 Tax=Streptomyces tremellae TaxID=1124239 RepID=A0ABP7ELH4_9ACTN
MERLVVLDGRRPPHGDRTAKPPRLLYVLQARHASHHGRPDGAAWPFRRIPPPEREIPRNCIGICQWQNGPFDTPSDLLIRLDFE